MYDEEDASFKFINVLRIYDTRIMKIIVPKK